VPRCPRRCGLRGRGPLVGNLATRQELATGGLGGTRVVPWCDTSSHDGWKTELSRPNLKPVGVAARIRVITVPAQLLAAIPDDESRVSRGMVEQVFTVSEVSDDGLAWIELR
jgi:hypothetical protein